jgi:hypothetical protein
MKKFYLVFVLIAMFQLPKSAVATHYAGCDLTYQCLGGNDYLFTLSFYRDSSGIDVSPTYDLNFTSSCGTFSVTLPMVTPGGINGGINVTPACPGQPTACDGGILYGVKKFVYMKQITLTSCANWVISFSGSARNTT